MTADVIVVGAGIAGLTAAHRLQQSGCRVRVLEAGDHAGGKTTAVRRDGFTLNTGATLLSGSYTRLLALADELGVADEIVEVAPRIGFYGVPEGEVHWLRRSRPQVLGDFARTRLLSTRSKFLLTRLVADVVKARKLADYAAPQLQAQLDTETVAEYCDRRLNAEIRDRLLGPIMSGLNLVDGAGVSVAGLFFSLGKLGGGTLGYRAGMDFIARALAERCDVVTGATVQLVERLEGGARVVWREGGEVHDELVDGVVLAVGPHEIAPIYPGVDAGIRRGLDTLELSTVFSIRLALRRRPAGDGLVVVVPHAALGGVGTVTFDHNLSPGSTPAGKGLIGILVGHEWVSQRLELSDDEIVQQILPDLERIVPGAAADLEFAQVTRWQPAGLVGELGSQRRVADVAARIDGAHRVQIAGEFLTIPGLEGSVVTAEAAARRLSEAVALRGAS